jgi:hypothetical protein
MRCWHRGHSFLAPTAVDHPSQGPYQRSCMVPITRMLNVDQLRDWKAARFVVIIELPPIRRQTGEIARSTLAMKRAIFCLYRPCHCPNPFVSTSYSLVSSALTCQRRSAAAPSYEACDERTAFCFTKYCPVMPLTSGELAR